MRASEQDNTGNISKESSKLVRILVTNIESLAVRKYIYYDQIILIVLTRLRMIPPVLCATRNIGQSSSC
jgi:hypothetical protein